MNQAIFKSHGLTPLEIEKVAALHKSGIRTGFLPSLGEGFLQLLYLAISRSDAGMLIVALQDGQVAGFVSGAVSLKPIYGLLLKENFFVLPLVFFPRMFNVQTLRKIADLLVYSFGHGKEKGSAPSAELLSIVVDEKYHSQGIAQALFEQLTVELQKRGVYKFKIVVGESLLPAQRFYEKMGAQKRRKIEMHKGEASWEYVFDLPNNVME